MGAKLMVPVSEVNAVADGAVWTGSVPQLLMMVGSAGSVPLRNVSIDEKTARMRYGQGRIFMECS